MLPQGNHHHLLCVALHLQENKKSFPHWALALALIVFIFHNHLVIKELSL
jgi:hypothetical protein